MTLQISGSGAITGITSLNTDVSSTELGYLDGVTSNLQTQLGNVGKILQVVRATDATQTSTSSSSFVDVTGMSISITPQSTTSSILLMFNFSYFLQTVNGGTGQQGVYQITDASNVEVVQGYALWESAASSAGRSNRLGNTTTLIGFTSPNTTSQLTYKLRFRVTQTNGYQKVQNDSYLAQMFALEIAA